MNKRAIGAGVAAGVLIIAAATVNAGETCKTNIAVLTDNRPALQAVKVTISRGGETIATRWRHSFTIKLPCGLRYTATATTGGKTAKRNFYAAGGTVKLPLN